MVLYVNSFVFPCLTFDLQRKIKKVHIIDFAFFTLNNSIAYDMPILAKYRLNGMWLCLSKMMPGVK